MNLHPTTHVPAQR